MSELRCYHVKACVTKDCIFENGSGDNQAYIDMLAYAKDDADTVIAELKAQKAQAEDDCAYWKNLAQKRNLTQPPDRAEEK